MTLRSGDAQRLRFAAVVVWYRPEADYGSNIRSYATTMRHVIVVDNSDGDNRALLPSVEGLRYIPLGENLGIAAALNRGLAEAARLGADWVLTMDQDSFFEPGELETLTGTVRSLDADPRVALVGCWTRRSRSEHAGRVETPLVITSGTLNRLAALQSVGGFDEGLFIDCVDFDLCYRLNSAGYRTLQDVSARLTHRQGRAMRVTRHGRDRVYVSYPPTRYYYQVRNNLCMIYRHPAYRRKASRELYNILGNILRFEEEKFRSALAAAEGVLHFLVGRYGPRGR